jgi:hypothetical protein
VPVCDGARRRENEMHKQRERELAAMLFECVCVCASIKYIKQSCELSSERRARRAKFNGKCARGAV